MNISDIKSAYFIGIKGSGMAALAEILSLRGVHVTGSDTEEKFFTDEILKRNGISFFEGFSADHVPSEVDVIVYSTAYSPMNNDEVARAQQGKVPLLGYPQLLGMLFEEKLGIAVCGTHGKTTTTAMLAHVLKHAGVDPSAIVGSQVIEWGGSTLYGSGNYFVAEADEYQNKLQYYNPWSAILTSVDWDHPDYFPDFKSYKDVFKYFVQKIPKTGFLSVWGDSTDTLDVAKNATCQVLTYGFGDDNQYVISNHTLEGAFQRFKIVAKEKLLGEFVTPLAGKHNVLNCAAVIAACHRMSIDLEKVKEALAEFKGTSRRFEYIGEYKGALLIDDYAHHPDEIRVTLEGARQRYEEKSIWVVFHPHTFSRTKALLQEFSQSFDDADHVIVIDIYGSAREQQGGVSSKDLVKLINTYVHGKAQHIPTIEQAVEILKGQLGSNDILLAMGAGDVWKVADRLKESR